ncbi:MAG TPA: hypothetical protein DCS93_34060 [Microscillaceae bacterium]|nr:hypothetical protein [Microscillaceae bacterium]
MSSHHIIRDEQEPALFIIDPDACSLELIQQLLGWSPTLVIVEQALDQVLAWGIKIDVVVCHETNLATVQEKTCAQLPIEIIAVEHNLVENGLRYLYHRNHVSVHVISYFEDEQFAQNFLEKMDLIVFNQEYKAFYVAKDSWKKWVTADTLFKVLPTVPDITLETQNLEPYQDEKISLNLHRQHTQAFRPQQEGFIQISNTKHPFWVFEKIK